MDGVGSNALQDEIRQASMRLPERQREALALRELDRLSYEKIATTMGTSAGSVPQLIARGRINLYDELRGTVLASVAPSLDCERALPLIAAREDDELHDPDDAAWLDDHLAGCERCRLAVEQMQEAGVLYRAETAPVAAMPPPAETKGRARWSRRRRALAAGLVALLFGGGVAAALVRNDGAPAPSQAGTKPAAEQGAGEADGRTAKAAGRHAGEKTSSKQPKKKKGGGSNAAGTAAADESAATPVGGATFTTDTGVTAKSPSGSSGTAGGKAGVDPTRSTGNSKPSPKPAPTPGSTQASQPAPEPAPTTTTTTTTTAEPPASVEEPVDAPGRSEEAPGKPGGHPSH